MTILEQELDAHTSAAALLSEILVAIVAFVASMYGLKSHSPLHTVASNSIVVVFCAQVTAYRLSPSSVPCCRDDLFDGEFLRPWVTIAVICFTLVAYPVRRPLVVAQHTSALTRPYAAPARNQMEKHSTFARPFVSRHR